MTHVNGNWMNADQRASVTGEATAEEREIERQKRLEQRSACLSLIVQAHRRISSADTMRDLGKALSEFSGVMAAACVVEDQTHDA